METLSSNSTTTTLTVEDQPPLSAAASVWCFSDQEPPVVLALPVPNHHRQDHPTAQGLFPCAPRIEDYCLPTKNEDLGNFAELIHAASSFSLSLFPPTKKPIKNHHPYRWDFDELIDAASSLSLSLPTKRKRFIIIGPKKPVEEEKGVIAKKQKVAVDKTSPTGRPQPLDAVLGNHHHHHHLWIHKRLSTSDVNLSSRLLLPKEDITKYVLPLMDMESYRACQNRDGLRVKIWDLDTESQHQLTLKQWKTGSFLLTSNWNTEFVKRRSLHQGDTISMCWDVQNLRFLFRKFNAQS